MQRYGSREKKKKKQNIGKKVSGTAHKGESEGTNVNTLDRRSRQLLCIR